MSSPTATPYRGRFAPSPSGELHFGSLVAAVGSWLRARSQHGTWLIRMEDLDPPRTVPGASQDIVATLAAFGMHSDEAVVEQSARDHLYHEALRVLRERGLVFACACSRADLQATAGLHRGNCTRPVDSSQPHAWRARVDHETVGFNDLCCGWIEQRIDSEVGDFVLRRVEGYYAYQLAVVVDDAEQAISEIVRGADLLDSTPRQIWLQRKLGYPTPRYLHLPVALDQAGRKLSKQDRARALDRSDPMPILLEALKFLGLPTAELQACRRPEQLLQCAIEHFDIDAIPAHRKSTARFAELP